MKMNYMRPLWAVSEQQRPIGQWIGRLIHDRPCEPLPEPQTCGKDSRAVDPESEVYS